MREQLQQLLKNYPRHYTNMIKKDPIMMTWIEANTKSTSESFPARIYSAAFDVTDMCTNGNQKKYSGLLLGFTGCGPAPKCKCTRDTIAIKSVQSHAAKSKEEKAASNEVRKTTMIEKYGVGFNTQREEVKEKLQCPKISGYALQKLSDKQWLTEQYENKYRSALELANELNVDPSTIKTYLIKNGITVRTR